MDTALYVTIRYPSVPESTDALGGTSHLNPSNRHHRLISHPTKTQFPLSLNSITSLIEGILPEALFSFPAVLIIGVLTAWDSAQKVTYVEHF